MEIPSTFAELLSFIGSPLFIGVVVSLVASRWDWFISLSGTVKFWLTGFICVVLPVLSKALLTYLPIEVVNFFEAWWPAVVVGLGVWVSSQAWYQIFGDKAQIKQLTDAHIGEKSNTQ